MAKNYKVIILILGLTLALSLAGNILLKDSPVKNLTSAALISPVLAENIYPMFLCPCCGQPLDKNNICCGMAKERIDYIDSLAAKNLSEKEIILAFVKKYGMDSFIDKNKQNEVKDELAKSAPAERPIIALTNDYYDFGDVPQKKGVVTTLFELKNQGEKDLIINKLDSSCGCTSASIVFDGQEGPRFAMAGHGIESPTDWQVSIPPEGAAYIKVYYDPDVHNDFRGPATREITVFSNDPIDFEKKITIDLNQVD